MDQSGQKQRGVFQFAAGVFTNPPFQNAEKTEQKPNEVPDVYYFQARQDFTTQESKSDWVRTKIESRIIQPYYSAQVSLRLANNKYPYFMVTGGVVYDGSPEAQNSVQAIPQTTDYCYIVQFSEDVEALRVNFLQTKTIPSEREVIINGKKTVEEFDDVVDLIPRMKLPRHNHSMFKVASAVKPDKFRYFAIGGQYFGYESEGENINYISEIYSEVEYFDEAAPSKWNDSVPPMQYPRTAFSGFYTQGKIFVFGGHSLNGILSTQKESEYLDLAQNKWVPYSFKFGLKQSAQLNGVLCLPLKKTPNLVLLIGGANNSGPTDQITMLDVNTFKLTLVPTKLQEPRAKMSHIFIRLDGKIYLVIFGGSPDSITVEYFEYIEDGLKTQLIPNKRSILRNIFVNEQTINFSFAGFEGEMAWIQAIRTMPNFVFSDIEVLDW